MPGTLLKLLVKDKLLHSGNILVNAGVTKALRSALRREKRGTDVQRYSTLKEAMNSDVIFTFHTRLSHILLFIPVLALPKRDWIQ